MRHLQQFSAGKPLWYPDQARYAAFACDAFGLVFEDIDAGSGLAFTVRSPAKCVAFGGGRCSYFPQNNATAATLASDKYLSSIVLEQAGVATLGGHYFFLTDRHRAHRPDGHERDDARACFRKLGGAAFVKPLFGSRGDFAQAVRDESALNAYLDDVSRHHDSILMQRIVDGREYRIVILDGDIVFCARKYPPVVTGDGARPLRALLAARSIALHHRGVSEVESFGSDASLDIVLPANAQWIIPGRMNRSAGGQMAFETPTYETAAASYTRRAMQALGLRAAGIDIFTDIADEPGVIRVIEVNANPSIRFLEDSGRDDLILKIWRKTFAAIGLLDV